MIISFAGHSQLYRSEEIKKEVKAQLQNSISKGQKVTCYLGGYGDFDNVCARVCRELKSDGYSIEAVYVTPYIPISDQSKIKEMIKSGLYDTALYPPLEGVLPRFAISKRNEWMMRCADLVIVYVKRTYGGAYASYVMAQRAKKRIINVYDMIGNKKR